MTTPSTLYQFRSENANQVLQLLFEQSQDFKPGEALIVSLQYGGDRLSASNPLPVTIAGGLTISGGGGGIASTVSISSIAAGSSVAIDKVPVTYSGGDLPGSANSSQIGRYTTLYPQGTITNGAWFRAAITNQNPIYIDCTGANGTQPVSTSIPLYPGDYYDLDQVPTNDLTVFITSLNDRFFSAKF